MTILQETHSTTDCQKKGKDDFGGDLHFFHGSSNSCGVLIVCNGNQNERV